MPAYGADLHLHSCLSPCGDLLMTPQNIIDRALDLDLDLIAITDHNSAENVEVAVELADQTPLTVFPGMEVETREEVHLLCLFAEVEQVLAWQQQVYDALPEQRNQEEVFGPQVVTDLQDCYAKKVDRLLMTATSFTVEEVVAQVKKLGGVVIPSHVDKNKYSLLASLGFIPPELEIEAVEISTNVTAAEARKQFPQLGDYSLVTNSDAHYLQEIKKSMQLNLSQLTLEQFKSALNTTDGGQISLLI